MNLDLAISPCPNDTFIFRHFLSENFLPFPVTLHLADVEELNRRAIEEGRHAITKISFYAMAKLQNRYRLLSAGGALGRGCGPLIVSSWQEKYPAGRGDADRKEAAERIRNHGRILIPGQWTTAHLLTRLFLKNQGVDLSSIEFIPCRYDGILELLTGGKEKFGVIIHEERFTFQDRGCLAVQDLGEWWEDFTGGPIPLGCIAVRSDVPSSLALEIEDGIRKSLRMAWADPESTMDFVRPHAQSLEDAVMKAHIDLYVNPYSENFGEDGRAAIERLFRLAEE